MPVTVSCGCGKTLSVPERLLGKKVRCPGCGAVFVAQAPGAVEPEGGFALDDGYQTDAPPPSAPGPEASMRFCKSCGASMQPDALVCLECGVNQDTGDRVGSLSKSAASGARATAWGKMVLNTLFLLILLGGIGVGFYYYHKSTSKPEEKPQAVSTANKPKLNLTKALEHKSEAVSAAKSTEPAKPKPKPKPASSASKKPPPKPEPAGVPKGAKIKKRENLFGTDKEWALGRYLRTPRRTRERMAVQMANKSIQMFKTAEGRMPKSLKEVVDGGYGPLNEPGGGLKLALDPRTGKAVLYEPPK